LTVLKKMAGWYALKIKLRLSVCGTVLVIHIAIIALEPSAPRVRND